MIGLRSQDEIDARIARPAEDAAEPPLGEGQVALIDAVLAVRETCVFALEHLRDIAVDMPAIAAAVERFAQRCEAIDERGVDVASLDFEAAYGRTSMEYYDGFVFGFYAEARPDLPPVATGGRYDALTRQLGQPALDSCGGRGDPPRHPLCAGGGTMSVKLGVPSKGRLMEKTFDWFAQHGITLSRTGSEREYAGAVSGVEGIDLVLLSAGEIPRELAAGRLHLGVTGTDLVREKLVQWDQKVEEIRALGFGHADLIVAVPQAWVDVDTLDDLDAAAAAFRAEHGFRLRIATKYHRLTRDYLRRGGVSDYQLVDSQGATEGTVKNLTAEAIADITSSGETLRANHLKILSEEPVLRSQATLYRSRVAPRHAEHRRSLIALYDALGVDVRNRPAEG